ncbi:syntaxin-17 [Sabethes cyaneus]|uniref:syntaxin-17 n=1 Tax=Sabethes cyaneus TaxID=53552 RepID=UPI00237D728F|nr:syntaxin-17 [Sabethes cyaneus]
MGDVQQDDKISLKLAEISIQKFNQSVPKHLSLLKNHKCNIEKAGSLKDWDRIKREQINATRVIKQMKYLILEIDKVRSRVQESDLERFDEGIDAAKKLAFAGMGEYLEMQHKFASRSQSSYSLQDDDRRSLSEDGDNRYGNQLAQVTEITSNYNREEVELRQRAECLKEMDKLQQEIVDIQELFQAVHTMTHDQAESINAVEENVEVTQVHVEAGETALRKALRYKKAIYPMCGALLGSCIGGPIGLIVGLKAGGLAAIGGGLVGFAGGKFVKNDDEIDAVDGGDKAVEVEANGLAAAERELSLCDGKE